MTGRLDGNEWNVLTRSKVRCDRQNAEIEAINATLTSLTFAGVVNTLHAIESAGRYTAKLSTSNIYASLSMLEKVGAVVTRYHFASMTITFIAGNMDICDICGELAPDCVDRDGLTVCQKHTKPLPMAELDRVLMLPIHEPLALPPVTVGDTVTSNAPEIDEFKGTVVSVSRAGVVVRQTVQAKLYGSRFDVESTIPYASLSKYKFTPVVRAYNPNPPKDVKAILARRDAEIQAKAQARSAAIKAENEAQRKIRELREQRTIPEITGEAVMHVQAQQGAATRKHSRVETKIVGQAPSGTVVKRWAEIPF